MSKKNKNQDTAADQTIATESMPVEQLTREQMLEHLAVTDPGMPYDECSDEELREYVAASMATDTEDPPEEPIPAPPESPEVKDPVDTSKFSPEAKKVIDDLEAQIKNFQAKGGGSKRVASGTRARTNVKYTLLEKPPSWHSTPQVAAIEKILFSQDHKELSEPELFALIEAGHKAGILQTRQNPVRIFQYYRTELLNHNVLRWQ